MSTDSLSYQQNDSRTFSMEPVEENEPPILAWSIIQHAIQTSFSTKTSTEFYEEIYRYPNCDYVYQ